MTEKEKSSSLEEALAAIHKKYGKESVVELDKNINIDVDVISTGCFSLDEALGCGGLAPGRIYECFGEESSGKSTLTTFLMAQIQKQGGRAALIDAEFAFDANYARAIGLDTSKLILAQPGCLEEAMDILNGLVKSNGVDIVVIDSVAALVPKSEIEGEGEMLRDTMAVQARLLGKALRIVTGSIAKSKTIVIFVNQTRDKVGVFFGNKSTTPGGKALKFFSSVRIDIKKGDKIEGKDKELIGYTLKAKIVKNKLGFPWREATFDLYFGTGIDLLADVLDHGEKKGVIKKVGNTYSFKDKKLGVGRDQAKKFLQGDPKTYEEVRGEIKKIVSDNLKKK
jgi:recombination protein RecA